MPKKGAAKVSSPVNDFFVVGSSTLDIIAKTKDAERVDIAGKHAEHLVCISFASKSELSAISISPGGSALNSSVALRALGSSVCLLSAVGKDEFGKLVFDSLARAGISSSNIKAFGNVQTGVGLVLLMGGEKSVLVFRGANSLLGPSDVSDVLIKNAKQVFISTLVSTSNFKLFEKIVLLAKKHNKPVIFAPSISTLHSWLPKIRSLHSSFNMVIVNYEEGSYYTGKTNVKEILKALPGKVVVVMKDFDGAYAQERGKSPYHVKAVPVAVRSTAGAGDAFSAAFVHSYYGGESIEESLKVAASTAALKLSHTGAQFAFNKVVLHNFMKHHSSSLVVRRL